MKANIVEPDSGAIPDDDLQYLVAHSTGPVQVSDAFEKTCVNVAPTAPVTSESSQTSTKPQRFGRYEVVTKLGEGGMGAVYKARDTETGQFVAVKVLSENCLRNEGAFRRFEKEARLLEQAQNPHIANMLDLGTDGQTRFLVMEFIDGCDLRKWIVKHGALEESQALDILSDLCRALAMVHSRGMVHRDIKPENVLMGEIEGVSRPQVKLTDFGLARHVDQSDSMKLTQTGALLGTPYYMAPEQFKGTGEVSPATDVYALGVTLFELLAGRRPFTVGDPIKLATAHCFEKPPDLRKLATNVSDAIADLVNRMLSKNPADRPPDAGALLEEILRFQNGSAVQMVLHPMLPDHDPTKVLSANFEWELTSPPEALWRYVSNTDRFNQAAGIPPVTYETKVDESGRQRKYGHFRMAGMTMRWEEHPFEWVEGRRFSILREFPAGPFAWFLSTVELIPRPEGGTLLKHQVKIEPRNMAGRMIGNLEVGIKGKRSLDRIYRRIDATISGRSSIEKVVDPFQRVPGLSRVQRTRLQRQLDQLRSVGVREEIVAMLHDVITNFSAQDLARIRPNALARRFGLPGREVVDACLHAVKFGTLTLFWDIICPTCRLASDAKQTLRDIEQHGNCSACQTDFKIEFGSSLEMIFRVHPEIRTAEARAFCNGGPGNFPHVVAQANLHPSERLVLNLTMEPGSYQLRGPRLPFTVPIEVDPYVGLRHGSIRCEPGVDRHFVGTLLAGHQQLTVENLFADKQLVRIERILRRSDAITAAQATGLPLFRQLFPQETLTPGQLVELATTNFLAVKLDGLEAAFHDRGDAAAYTLLRDFERIVSRNVNARGGSVIDDQMGLLLLCFNDPVVAIETARGLYADLSQEQPNEQWSLSGGVHCGSALVTSDRHEIRYFGATVSDVVNLARQAPSGKLLLTKNVWPDPGVTSALSEHLLSSSVELLPAGDSLRQMELNVPAAIPSKLPSLT